jgi:hypothetical protein
LGLKPRLVGLNAGLLSLTLNGLPANGQPCS